MESKAEETALTIHFHGMRNTTARVPSGGRPATGNLAKNPDGKRPVVGGNTFVVVEADGDDLVHSDGKTAKKAVELLEKYKSMEKPFGSGWVLYDLMFPS